MSKERYTPTFYLGIFFITLRTFSVLRMFKVHKGIATSLGTTLPTKDSWFS
jgi:hypothetical protein